MKLGFLYQVVLLLTSSSNVCKRNLKEFNCKLRYMNVNDIKTYFYITCTMT